MRYEHDHESDVIYFGKTNFRNAMRKFGVKTDDRRRHMYVIGKTGMGKTTLLENMILADIYAGHGCCYVDPHGDTAEKLIDYIPSWRINDVVYFNPSDLDYPIGFNILESVDPTMKHLVASSLMSVFKKIWENVWSARMEYILNNTILALLDTSGSTLLGINRMLSDKDYRAQIITNVTDPIVKQFWLQEFAQYDAKFATEAVAPIQNKIGQFLSSSVIRNIVAQAKSSINIRDIMDSQKIFIINLSKGRVGEDAMRLLGGMLITKIQMSAMERVNVPESERNDFYLYVDEFQNFAVESFASVLSEARKYRLNLIMAHQYIAQLEQGTSTAVRDAVFGNVGSMVFFRVGSPDAVFLENELMPRFTPEDIINLPKHAIYVKLMIDGVTSHPFSAQTLPPIAQRTGSAERVIAQSRERYAGNKAQIEEHVATWAGFDPNVDVAGALAAVAAQKKEDKKKRYSHEYDCTRCGKKFLLPVELDRSRPIYCEECHPIVMEERKKGKEKKEVRQKGKESGPAPKVHDGEPVAREAGESMSLSALSPVKKPEASPPKPVPAHDDAAPRAGDMLNPLAPMNGGSQEGTGSPSIDGGGSGVVGRKRRRRRRNRGNGGDAPAAAPQQVMPGERITFDEEL
ncbi:type IV secretion system DNA-binding domain-containing protein [Candidatus Uhrbacteria bacterium]|nr:type IV secretion system DNA-binding domain-containing protein [Candidatus Uhrbacteria bacterium]